MRQPGDRAPAPEALALVQDLANTVDIEMGRDALRVPDNLTAFCAAHGLGGLTVDEPEVAEARRLREAPRDPCQAHTAAAVPPPPLAVLDDLLASAPLRLAIDPAGGARAVPAAGLDGLPALAAHLATGI